MTTYYDPITKKWYHEKEKTLGHNKLKTIKPLQHSKSWLTFPLNEKSHHIGPIVGIVTSKGKKGKIAGNGPLFQSLHQQLYKLGALAILFTPDDLEDSGVTGYTFLPALEKWQRIFAPLPNVVYNRIPFRNRERDAEFIGFVAKLQEKNIPFFNPCFINKWEMYQLFRQSLLLQPLLPKTHLLLSGEMCHDILQNAKQVYLKPVNSAKGKGIFRVQIDKNQYLLEDIHLTQTFNDYEQLWQVLTDQISDEPYLIQEAIHPALYNGSRYDFRILTHRQLDHFSITGVGIRQSSHQQVTTHVPNGGKLLPYELFQTQEIDLFFNEIIQEIGSILTESIGLFGEFSLDIGLSKDGNFYLYEVNSKPMSFDEEEIEKKRMMAICRLCGQLSGIPMAPDKFEE